MRAYVPAYQLISPPTLSEALEALSQNDGAWKPFAGGTDLMVLLEAGKLPHRNYVNIWNLKELRGIEVSDDHVTLGALTTYTEVQAHPMLREEFPMLVRAASETGGIAIQNRGTLGETIIRDCNAVSVYGRWKRPTRTPFIRMCPSIAFITSLSVASGPRVSLVSSAKSWNV